ncbi:MAG: hypothetical protein JST54_33500 [Deltaproteobacteria bacterium]|nr:hypothetical protein [Deltaproteobacteria bacterium]
MAVGGVKGGGKRGGVGGTGGAKGASGAGKSFRVEGNEGVGKTESLVGASRAAGSASVDPVTTSLQQIAKDLASGAISSKSEATKQAVQTILQKKGMLGKNGKSNKKLVEQIADTLEEDPRLAAALERTWSRAGK